jgi:hypothetical protein
MQRLTLNEVMSITNIGIEQLKSMRRRGQFAAAFSCKDAFATLRYSGVDCVAVLLTSELARTFSSKEAATLVLMFGGSVLRAIADAEHGSADVLLGIADLVREDDGRRAHLACAAPDVGAEGHTTVRVVTCNVSRLIRRVRASAERVGIDLSAPFMPARDSAALDAILAGYTELQAVVEHGARRKRLAGARHAGERARQLAMGGTIHRKRARASEVTASAI